MKVMNSIHSVSEEDAYWFNTYHKYYINKLSIIEFIYNFYLLYINGNDKDFRVVGL